jgi:NAD(P)H-dependent FMN reductase
MSDLFIPVLLGTARPGRQSELVAAHVLDTVKQRFGQTELIDVADFPISATGLTESPENLDRYRETVGAADGYVLVVPEYNHGYPGELKLLLDAEYHAYGRKPVGFVSVSSGMIGGARVVEQLRLVAAALRMVPVSPAVHVSNVAEAVTADGRFTSASLDEVLAEMLAELDWFASALTPARAAS